jgi:hypothetical protein
VQGDWKRLIPLIEKEKNNMELVSGEAIIHLKEET